MLPQQVENLLPDRAARATPFALQRFLLYYSIIVLR
jgi:hypothetical protein